MQADRKMEPWMLRDLAAIARAHMWGKDTDWTRHLDGEAARREAEAKELGRALAETATVADARDTPQGERQGPDSAAADMLYAVHIDRFKPVGFTLADVRDAQSAMRNAAKKLRVEGYPATADDLDHHANLLDGGAKRATIW